jgi:hypothetical protein
MIGGPVLGRGAPPLTTARGPETTVAVPPCGTETTARGATAAAWKTGGIAPRPCACTPAGRRTMSPAKRMWRTMGTYLKAKPSEPSSNDLAHLQGCAHPAIGFNPNPSIPLHFPIGVRHPQLNPRRSFPCPTPSYSLSPILPALCYNHPVVERAAKSQQAHVQAEPAQTAMEFAASLQNGPSPVDRTEDPSRYCPVCSQRLESRRCKLICSVCGYYMSCADYY